MTVKIAMLLRGKKFSPEEESSLAEIQKVLRSTALTMISFFQCDGLFDKGFIIKKMSQLESLLKGLVAPHLTDKSVQRVEQVGFGKAGLG